MHFFVANARRRDILVRASPTGRKGIAITHTASPQQARKLEAGAQEVNAEYDTSRDTRRAEPEVDDVSGKRYNYVDIN